MKKNIFIFIVFYFIAIGLIVYFTALTFHYIEGDDASTILYHLMGRNKAIQLPYAAYHSMFDYILCFLPRNESILLSFSMLLSYIFSFILIILLAYYTYKYINIKNANNDENINKYILYFLLIIPFLIPEFIFFGLLYNPTVIGMSLLIGSYLLFLNNKSWKNRLLCILLFGIGISFRWNLAMFGVTFIVELIWEIVQKDNTKNNIINNVLFVLGLILSPFLFIYISGYSPKDFFEILLWGKSYVDKIDFSLFSFLGCGASMFTPLFIILFILGIIRQIVTKDFKILILLVCNEIPLLLFKTGLLPKMLITLFPFILIICCTGFIYLVKNRNYIINSIVVFLLFVPWFVGVNINVDNTLWGPGFEKKTTLAKHNYESNNSRNPNKRLKNMKVKMKINGGFAIPTPEGARPFWGYFYVIFGGQWKQMFVNFYEEMDNSINFSKRTNSYLILDTRFSYIQCILFKKGYKCNTKFITDSSQNIYYRKFISGTDSVIIITPLNKNIDINWLSSLKNVKDSTSVYVSNTNAIINLNNLDKFIMKGPLSGIYILDK